MPDSSATPSITSTSPYPRKLLVVNRAEIACRILRAAAELGVETVAVYPQDDESCAHVGQADSAILLAGAAATAYLDVRQLVAVATAQGCDAVHPGYGFLSENPDLARAVEDAGLIFVGPTPETLAKLGNKTEALDLAIGLGVPVLSSTSPLSSPAEAETFVAEHGGAMLKAVAGGGGRGMRPVTTDDVAGGGMAEALQRCRSEALSAFGNDQVYAEQLISQARHIEVQVVGDGTGAATHLWERECTLQRQNQKIIELAPAPGLDAELRTTLLDAATKMAATLNYRGLGTFEFLVDSATGQAYFIEANARIQVEHTVTEEITGIDLLQTQLAIAGGATLADLGLVKPPLVTGQAVQLRINTEVMQADGTARPSGGQITRFDTPSGLGVRIETHGYSGYTTSPAYDSLLAKLVVHVQTGGLPAALARARRALDGLVIEGVGTNKEFLAGLISHPAVIENQATTQFVAEHAADLLGSHEEAVTPRNDAASSNEPALDALTDSLIVAAPMQGTIVSIDIATGDEVAAGETVMIMEAMKMEHLIIAEHSGIVASIGVSAGEAVFEGHTLLAMQAADISRASVNNDQAIDLDRIRPDLAEVHERHGYGLDENRAEAVAKRQSTGKRTARENVADLVDPDTFTEWGPLVVAAQRKRRSIEELIEKTPGDGMVGGIGAINGTEFGEDDSQCIVVSYDYMVMAGTQGFQNHRKKDRLFEIAHDLKLPVILFAEGGGGRPGDTDGVTVAGLDCMAFALFAKLSGEVPLIGINAGYCFAGNAALLGCCDVVIATRDSNVGMGGPAMIEGGGLGVFHPKEIGPADEQSANGVIDVLVDDEAEAVRVAKQYLSYFQGPKADWTMADQRKLRHAIPENRLRIYDVREVIDTMFDEGSVLELRQEFGIGMITALARVEGRTVGVIANNPVHLAGAIDSDGADKSCRFMQLCDAYGIPVVFLCDTPGFMVGPDVERTALVRHAARLFVTSASLSVPFCTIVLRKGYGLGAQAMAGGSFKAPIFTIGWPTSEFGGMGLEGAVKLGYRNELAAIEDPDERQAAYESMVAKMYEIGKGTSMADHFEIDDVIDPMESRRWIMTAFRSGQPGGISARKSGGRRPFVDTW